MDLMSILDANLSDGKLTCDPPLILTQVTATLIVHISLINLMYFKGIPFSSKIYHITSLRTLSYAFSRSMKILEVSLFLFYIEIVIDKKETDEKTEGKLMQLLVNIN